MRANASVHRIAAAAPQVPFEDWMTWYVEPGSYTIEVTLGGETKSAPFKVARGAGGFGFGGEPGSQRPT